MSYFDKEKSGWEHFLDWDCEDCVFASFVIPLVIGLVPGMVLCCECCKSPSPDVSIWMNLARVGIGILVIFNGYFLAVAVNIVGNIIRLFKTIILSVMETHAKNERKKEREYQDIESRYSRLVRGL